MSKTYSMAGWRPCFAGRQTKTLIQALTLIKCTSDYGALTAIQVDARRRFNGPAGGHSRGAQHLPERRDVLSMPGG